MGQLSGKVAAVTGGASCIGEATVRRFIAEGAQVAFADRDVERGQRVAAEIETSGGKVLFVETHIEQEAAVAAFIQSTVEHFGQLNLLVNNAGVRLYHRPWSRPAPRAGTPSWVSI
jgi:meso-butanediol dehydrogenase / (S,S)-butanediol dehydrogenase / diacetyl reductase